MLSSLRNAAGTWVAKLLLLLLVLSFAVWGISDQITGGSGGDAVVTAGRTQVSANEYRLAYDRQVNMLSQQFGQRLTRDQITAFGIDNQILGQLVAGAVLDEQARTIGLGLSKDRLASLTAEDPAFQGPDGRFNRQQFDYVLRQVGMRPEDYFNNRAQVAIRQQIVEAASDGMEMPDTFLRAVALYRGEDRTIDYLVLPRSTVEPIEAPAEDVLSAWFEENKARYAAPEYRKISYVKLEPEDIADETSITDEQVREDYESNKDSFTTPETRTIEQLVFPTPEAANMALDAVRGGATFENIVKAQGKTQADTLLGTLSKDKIADKAIADAAFSLAANEISPVVEGAFGPVLLRVTDIEPETVKSLSDASAEIRKELALREANRILLEAHDSYEDSRAAGETMKEAADKLKLQVVTVDAVDRAGQRPDGAVVNTLPQSRELLQAAFETETGIENPPVNIGSNGYVFYEVEGITPARDRSLDEVRDKVVADWTQAETDQRLAAKGEELQKRLKDGAKLDDLATELSLEKQTKRGLKRGADDADFGREGVAAAFAVAEGGVGLTPSPTASAQILFQVADVFEPAGVGPDAVPQEVRNQYSDELAGDLLDQLVAQLQTRYQVTVNRDAIARALAF